MPDTNGTGVNNVANVSTTKFLKGGYLFWARLSDTLTIPTDIGTQLSADFKCLGFISEDGLSESVDGGSETIPDANGTIVHTYKESHTETLTVTPIEVMAEALKLQLGSDNVTDADGVITASHNWGNANDEFAMVAELVLKDGRRWRKVIPRANVSEVGEASMNSTTVTGREVTITYLADADGVTCVDYIQSTDTQAHDPQDDQV